MASSFPAGYDSFGNPIPNDALDSITLPHATDQHARMNDAIEAVQGALGLDPQGSEATVAARVAAMETDADTALALAEGLFGIITGKGDLIVGLADNTPGILEPGPDGWALVADSAQDTGLAWADVGAGEGVGIPPGGSTGQALVKLSDDDYDVGWDDVAGIVGGGTASVIAQEPYPEGGDISTYTDGVSGYEYRVHVFEHDGGSDDQVQYDFVVHVGVIGNLLMVAGGGGTGYATAGPWRAGSPGGAGGLIEEIYAFGANTPLVPVHVVKVGRGGIAGISTAFGEKGFDSQFDDLIAYGGGVGYTNTPSVPTGLQDGGSGGGTGTNFGDGSVFGTNGTGVVGQGHDGLNKNAGGALGQPTGKTSSITGSALVYARGGYEDSTVVANRGYGGRGVWSLGGEAGSAGVVVVRYRIA